MNFQQKKIVFSLHRDSGIDSEFFYYIHVENLKKKNLTGELWWKLISAEVGVEVFI